MTETLSIVTVLEHYGADCDNVPEHGWRSVKCPFHDDGIASGRVNIELGGFICMACQAKGDAVKLIMDNEGTDFNGAREFANEIFGASLPNVSRSASKRKSRKRSLWRHTLFDEPRD